MEAPFQTRGGRASHNGKESKQSSTRSSIQMEPSFLCPPLRLSLYSSVCTVLFGCEPQKSGQTPACATPTQRKRELDPCTSCFCLASEWPTRIPTFPRNPRALFPRCSSAQPLPPPQPSARAAAHPQPGHGHAAALTKAGEETANPRAKSPGSFSSVKAELGGCWETAGMLRAAWPQAPLPALPTGRGR